MQNVDGVELARWIRGQEKFKGIPIIAVTAYVFAEMKKMYLEKGFDHILEKPFSRKDFLEMLKAVTQHNKQ